MRNRPLEDRFHEKYCPEPNTGCWLWTGLDTNRGYGLMKMRSRRVGAHRVAAFLHGLIDSLTSDLQVLHKCDTPRCVNPAHLFVGTGADNMRDKSEKNRCNACKGEKHGRSKLLTMDILNIRGSLNDVETLAEKYAISVNHVRRIIRRQTWKHI